MIAHDVWSPDGPQNPRRTVTTRSRVFRHVSRMNDLKEPRTPAAHPDRTKPRPRVRRRFATGIGTEPSTTNHLRVVRVLLIPLTDHIGIGAAALASVLHAA